MFVKLRLIVDSFHWHIYWLGPNSSLIFELTYSVIEIGIKLSLFIQNQFFISFKVLAK